MPIGTGAAEPPPFEALGAGTAAGVSAPPRSSAPDPRSIRPSSTFGAPPTSAEAFWGGAYPESAFGAPTVPNAPGCAASDERPVPRRHRGLGGQPRSRAHRVPIAGGAFAVAAACAVFALLHNANTTSTRRGPGQLAAPAVRSIARKDNAALGSTAGFDADARIAQAVLAITDRKLAPGDTGVRAATAGDPTRRSPRPHQRGPRSTKAPTPAASTSGRALTSTGDRSTVDRTVATSATARAGDAAAPAPTAPTATTARATAASAPATAPVRRQASAARTHVSSSTAATAPASGGAPAPARAGSTPAPARSGGATSGSTDSSGTEISPGVPGEPPAP